MRFPKPFSGQLGTHAHWNVHPENNQNAEPVASHPCPTPKQHEDVFRNELDCRCEIESWRDVVLQNGFLLLLHAQKDGGICVMCSMRALNEVLKCKVCDLPKNQCVLRKRPGHHFSPRLTSEFNIAP